MIAAQTPVTGEPQCLHGLHDSVRDRYVNREVTSGWAARRLTWRDHGRYHVCNMDFEALLWQAIRRCGSQLGLARTLGYNKNAIRQWLLGLSLPDSGVEPQLAQVAGVTRDVLRQAIRDEMIRRWDRARNRPTIRRGRLGRPPQLADPIPLPVVGQQVVRPKNASDKKARRGQTITALLASLGLGLATLSHAAAPSDVKDSVARRREAA